MGRTFILNVHAMDTSILGIDVASRKLDLLWSNGSKQEHATINYDKESLSAYVKARSELVPTSCIVGLESTGDYHLAAARFFLERGFPVKVLNPIITKRYTQTTVRGIKTDKTDAQIIARLVAEGEGDPATLSDIMSRERELLRLSRSLTTVRSQLTLRLQSLQRKEVGQTKKIERKIEKVITLLHELSDELVDEATQDRSPDEELIDSIPGFATKLSAIVHYELGDVNRFKNARSLVSFAGLDPRIKQSGHKLNTTGRLLKRGSPYLRTALFVAANIARQYDPELHEYYQKKKMEGRAHTEILCMIARKLLYRIWAVLRDQRQYQVTNKVKTQKD